MPAWLDIILSAPLMAEPPTPGAHVPLEFDRRGRSRVVHVDAVLRHGLRVRVRPTTLKRDLAAAHSEGRVVRVKVTETFTQRKHTDIHLYIEIDTPWAREQPSNPAGEKEPS